MTDQSRRLAARAPAIYLLRHGETFFNTRYHEHVDPIDFDSRLTDRGRRQAAGLADRIAELAPDLVMTSPLTRALQTTQLACRGLPVQVESILRERQYNSCDIGRPASVLADEFPQWDFQHLAENWWYQDAIAQADHRGIVIEPEQAFLARLTRFHRYLYRHSTGRLVIVGHSTFFYYLCGAELGNCELLELPSKLLALNATRLRDGRYQLCTK